MSSRSIARRRAALPRGTASRSTPSRPTTPTAIAGQEHNTAAPYATDGSATYWETEHYHATLRRDRQARRRSRPRCEEPVQLNQLGFTSPTPGFTADIRAGDSSRAFPYPCRRRRSLESTRHDQRRAAPLLRDLDHEPAARTAKVRINEVGGDLEAELPPPFESLHRKVGQTLKQLAVADPGRLEQLRVHAVEVKPGIVFSSLTSTSPSSRTNMSARAIPSHSVATNARRPAPGRARAALR